VNPSRATGPADTACCATPPVTARLVDWVQWRRRCALARCTPDTAEALRGFAWTRFRACCERRAVAPSAMPTAAECWHRFEVHLVTGKGRRGKRYKAWLFHWARTCDQPPLAALALGATLLMRDVVRVYLAQEQPLPNTVSLHAPLSRGRDGSLTAEDLLPAESDPADEVAAREFLRIGRREAARHWGGLSRRERVALAAQAHGMPLAQPDMLRAARCGRSALHAAYHGTLERLAARLRLDYAGEEPGAMLLLARHALRDLSGFAAQWARNEPGCIRIFRGVEAPTWAAAVPAGSPDALACEPRPPPRRRAAPAAPTPRRRRMRR
jgi:hypothetical protein